MSPSISKGVYRFALFFFLILAFILLTSSAQAVIKIKMYDGPELPKEKLATLVYGGPPFFLKSINGLKVEPEYDKPIEFLLSAGVQTLVVDIKEYLDFRQREYPALVKNFRILEGLESNTIIKFEAIPKHKYKISDRQIPLIKKDDILYFFHFTKLCVFDDWSSGECLNLRPEDEPEPISSNFKDIRLFADTELPPESIAQIKVQGDGLQIIEITGTSDDQQQIVSHGVYRDRSTIHLKPGKYVFTASYYGPYIQGAAESLSNATAELEAKAGGEYNVSAKISGGGRTRTWLIHFSQK